MDIEDLQDAFPGVDFGMYLKPNYNIAPSQNILAIPDFDKAKASLFHWGLIPSWSKDKDISYKMINARSETLAEKPSFKKPFKNQRCLILSDGFYEWKRDKEKKIPTHIRLKSGKPFAFAGLWEKWIQGGQLPVFSCTIITTSANSLLQPVHPRMPVILKREDYNLWLDSDEKSPEILQKLLVPFEPDEMEYHPVSSFVNNPNNNSPECIKAISA